MNLIILIIKETKESIEVFIKVVVFEMSLNESSLEKKLSVVTNSQDNIQSLSLWILHHKTHYKRIIQIWFNCFERGLNCFLSIV